MRNLSSEITAEIKALKASSTRLHALMLAVRGPQERVFDGALNDLSKAIIGFDSTVQNHMADKPMQ